MALKIWQAKFGALLRKKGTMADIWGTGPYSGTCEAPFDQKPAEVNERIQRR